MVQAISAIVGPANYHHNSPSTPTTARCHRSPLANDSPSFSHSDMNMIDEPPDNNDGSREELVQHYYEVRIARTPLISTTWSHIRMSPFSPTRPTSVPKQFNK